MYDAVGLKIGERGGHAGSITDVGLQERMAGVVRERRQRRKVGRIGQLVDVQYLNAFLANKIPNQRRSDKAGAAGHQHTHRYPLVQTPPGARASKTKAGAKSFKAGCLRSLSASRTLAGSTGQLIAKA